MAHKEEGLEVLDEIGFWSRNIEADEECGFGIRFDPELRNQMKSDARIEKNAFKSTCISRPISRSYSMKKRA